VENALDLADSSAVNLGDLATVMPYFTKARMHPNCDREISRFVYGSGMTQGCSTLYTCPRR
jgi:hypothetical protein